MARHGMSCPCCLQDQLKTKCVYLLWCTRAVTPTLSLLSIPTTIGWCDLKVVRAAALLSKKAGGFPLGQL